MPEMAKTADGLSLSLDEQEAGILRELAREMRLLLEADIPAQDDVLQRLFPRAHEDDEEQRSYEQLVGDDLRTVKTEALETVENGLAGAGAVSIELTDSDVECWLRVVNDLRLAIGTRLEVDDEKMGKPYDPSDPEAPALSVLHWLGWLQGSILEEIAGDVRPDP